MTDLSGKSALVTDASRGIGCASAFALAKAGAEVTVHYRRGTQEAGGSASWRIREFLWRAYRVLTMGGHGLLIPG
jgi:NAD(P)-dependent dehydrogenase (short-subunit alcohol dehydrogenase family)